MGDALAVALLESRGFTREDFALAHPGGIAGPPAAAARGRPDAHAATAIPRVGPDTPLAQGLVEMTRKGLGMTAVIDAGRPARGHLHGRRPAPGPGPGHRRAQTPMRDVMTASCKTIAPGVLAAEAVHLLEQYKINGLLVVDEGRQVVGALNIHDLLRAGVM